MKKQQTERTRLKNIFLIYKRDLKNILHNPVALLIALALMILPSLYAWVNIVACWDPYGNTNGIQVAVVNQDAGVTLQGMKINAGDEIIKNLQENDSIGWQFVSEEKAEYGLNHDRYYAMLRIPENFSAQLVDVFDDSYTKPQIIYQVNEKSNAIAPKITDTAAKTVTNEVSKAIIDVVDQVAFATGNSVSAELDSNEDKIKKLRDAVIAVNDHFDELETGLEKANEGLTTVEDLLQSANETIPYMEDGIAMLQDFSAQSNVLLGDAEQFRADGVDYIADKFQACQQLLTETRELLTEAEGKLADTEDLTAEIPAILDKAERLQQKLDELLSWLREQDIQDPEYDKWLAGLEAAERGAEKLCALLEQLEANPQQVKQVLLAVYETTDRVLQGQQAVLQRLEADLEKLLDLAQTEEAKAVLQKQLQQNQEAQKQLQQTITETEEKREHLAALTDEELQEQLAAEVQKLEALQIKIEKLTYLLQQMQESGFAVEEALQELGHVSDVAEDGVAQAHSLLKTADKAFVLADDVLLKANQTIEEMDLAIQDVTAAYETRWSDVLDTVFLDLHGALYDLDEALARADSAIPQVTSLLELGSGTAEKGEALLAELNEAVPEAKAEVQRLSTVMSAFSDENLDALIRLLETDADAAADYFSGPVELKEERLYHLDNYGSAMAPFYTVLALWVGCLLLSALLTTEAAPLQKERPNTAMEEYFGKMLTFLTLAIGQSLIVALGDKYILGVTVTDLGVFVGFSLFTTLVFILIVYTLVSILGAVGKAVCVVLLVLQIAGAGGTFPVEVMPEFYQIIQPYLPFTYAIGAMREAISGPVAENLLYDFQHLLFFGLIGLALGVLLKKPLHPLIEWFNKKFKESGLGE